MMPIRAEFQVTRDALVKRRRRRAVSARPVLVEQVHPLVWESALRLAGGDPARLEVVSLTEVLVR